jgi:hypothetical protein
MCWIVIYDVTSGSGVPLSYVTRLAIPELLFKQHTALSLYRYML